MIIAANHGYEHIVKYLCFNGANVNARTNSGATALHGAAYYNYYEVAKILIDHKAEKNLRDGFGNTPLDYARMYGYSEMAELLSHEVPKYTIKAQFESQDWESFEGPGPCGLTGHAFWRVNGSESKTCAGQNVYVMPYNHYTKEILDTKLAGKHDGFINTDPRLKKYIRKTVCGQSGLFSFDNMPCGTWIISTRVEWQVPVGRVQETRGGQLMKSVKVNPGQPQQIFLSNENKSF